MATNVLMSDRAGTPLLADTAAAVLAPVYLGLPLGSLVGVHAIGGREAVLLLIATVVVSDTAQFYTGRTFGRTPLAPLRSPKKTREGALGGFVIAPVFLAVAGSYWLPTYRWYWLAALGVGIVVAGIIGDLFESMLKRAADMKDSGTLIPGHGGVLDRIDALLFAAPIFYLFLRMCLAARSRRIRRWSARHDTHRHSRLDRLHRHERARRGAHARRSGRSRGAGGGRRMSR